MGTAAGVPGGGGTGANPVSRTGPTGAGAVSDPAAKTQQGGGNAPGQSGGQPAGSGSQGVDGGSGGAPSFNTEELDPALKGMGPRQINELFTALLERSRAAGGADNSGNGGSQPAPAVEQEPDYKAMMDPNNEAYDPKAAFQGFIDHNYGKLIGDINSRSVKGLYGNFRQQFPDFGEYEADIDKALAHRDPKTVTENDIAGIYLMNKGLKLTQKERQERATQAGRTTAQPSAARSSDSGPPELDDTEREYARTMFPTADDPAAKYQEWKNKIGNPGQGYQLTVPIDAAGKRG